MMRVSRCHIELTGACNLRCTYCYNARYQESDRGLTKEKLVSIIRQINSCGPSSYTISGGEPLLREDLEEVLSHCEADIILFTNALLLSDRRIESLASINRFKGFRVSLDGLASHDKHRSPSRYQDVVERLERISSHTDKDLGVATMLSKDGIAELRPLYELLKIMRLKHWRVDIPFFSGRYASEKIFKQADFLEIILAIRDLIVSYKQDQPGFALGIASIYKSDLDYSDMFTFDPDLHPCAYNMEAVCIRPNGDLAFCPSLNLVFGNVIDGTNVIDLIRHARENNDFFKTKISQIKGCTECRYLRLCGGGCRADSIYLMGDLLEKDVVNCSLLPLIEEHILPVLSHAERAGFLSLLDESGSVPVSALNIASFFS
jgi:radical SAM protein with 4Fe4S-binding SPASM domain